jgi:hypothetical protein
MSVRKSLILGLMIFLVISFFTKKGAADTLILGLGTASCGSWKEARSSGQGFPYEQWVVGFISAIATATSEDLIHRHNLDAQGIWHWVDNYCASHPLEMIGSATAELIDTLRPGTLIRIRPRRE